MRVLALVFALAWLASAPVGLATGAFDAEVTPFVGGGTTSGAQITAVTGASLSLGRDFALGSSAWRLAPRLELIDSSIDTKAVRAGTTTLGSYSNRVVALGARLSHTLGAQGFAGQRVYGTLVVGRSQSRLSVDASSPDASTMASYDGITGSYGAAEVGTQLPLRAGFGLTLAAVSSLYRQELKHASGRMAEDRLSAGGQLSLSGGEQNADRAQLPGRSLQRTLALKCGLSLSF